MMMLCLGVVFVFVGVMLWGVWVSCEVVCFCEQIVIVCLFEMIVCFVDVEVCSGKVFEDGQV